MSELRIYPRDKLVPLSMATGQHHRVVIHHFKVAMVELEDLHFHHDSAVLMPDHDPADATDAKSGADLTALSVLRACYLYAKDNPKKKVVCLGHTDRSGNDAYNIELSALRAKNVWAVMMGKQDEWTAVCKKKHVASDYQLILKWLANVRYWLDCDPGKIDGIHGNQTSNALRAFKKHYNKDYGGSLADSGAVDKATWDAFFEMYMVGLAGVMQVDEGGLDPYRQSFDWLSPGWDGCGEAHPKTPSTVANYRSPVDRRVEVLFFEPGEEPRFRDCHPSAKSRVPEQCELYRKDFLGKPFYKVTPIPVETSATVSLSLAEVRGLYKPGFSDPADIKAKNARASGYQKGYKSQDDLGRIFINQIPRVDTTVSWEDVKKKNQQYIELSATVEVAAGALPEDAQAVWEWTDPVVLPNESDMRNDAVAVISPEDPATGKRKLRNGVCDFPKDESGGEPTFEQIAPYTMEADPAASNRCFTLISGGKSEVRLHCTDAGGDLLRVRVTVRPRPGLKVTAGDETGTMAMWKRIDVEHRRMKDAESIPAGELAPYFERQYVQMDVAPEALAKSNTPYVSPSESDDRSSRFVENEFKNKYKPGWFFICVAREAEPPVGSERHSLYEGPGKLVLGGPVPLVPPGPDGTFEDNLLPQWESIVINAVLAERPLGVRFYEAGKTIAFKAADIQPNVPAGKSTIRLRSIDFQSDFEHGDGTEKKAYEKRAFYFPRYRYRWPEQVWERKGYGFGDDVYVNVMSKGRATTGGISPGASNPDGFDCFAGRTIIFCRHPSYTKPASARVEVGGTWSSGDLATVDVDGTSVSYTVTANALTVPPGVPDPALYVHGQIARGIESAINGSAVMSKKATAFATFGKVAVSSIKNGADGDGTPMSVASVGTGTLTLSSPILTGGGFDDKSRQEIVSTFTHELGHAFGFPHKCGYHTFEQPAGTACAMNYTVSWLYKLGTHLNPSARQVERFVTGREGRHFCAHHTRGIRLVQLEKNLAMWKWK